MAIDADVRDALAEAVGKAASSGPRNFIAEDGAPQRDTELWARLTGEMGLAALLIPEQYGGAGAGISEMAMVLEILANRLAVVPALSSMAIATALLRTLDGDGVGPLLEEMAVGTTTATVAWPASTGLEVSPDLVAHGEASVGTQVAVSGSAQFLLDGLQADVIVAPACIAGTQVVVSVDASDQWVQRWPMPAMDLTRSLAKVQFTEASGTVLAVEADLGPALDLAVVLIAAEQVGVAQQCHHAALAWAKERVQFDRPIGQFQAIKHQLVDLLMCVELARSCLDVAVEAADAYLASGTPEAERRLSVASSAAKDRCGTAAMHLADESLHILGGIGFTWEHDAHLYFRRAKTLEVLLGNPAEHRRRFARLLLEDARG